MLKITEKVTRYDIENLNEADYGILLGLFSSSRYYFTSRYTMPLPPIGFAIKVLKKEDVCNLYNISELQYNQLLIKKYE